MLFVTEEQRLRRVRSVFYKGRLQYAADAMAAARHGTQTTLPASRTTGSLQAVSLLYFNNSVQELIWFIVKNYAKYQYIYDCANGIINVYKYRHAMHPNGIHCRMRCSMC